MTIVATKIAEGLGMTAYTITFSLEGATNCIVDSSKSKRDEDAILRHVLCLLQEKTEVSIENGDISVSDAQEDK